MIGEVFDGDVPIEVERGDSTPKGGIGAVAVGRGDPPIAEVGAFDAAIPGAFGAAHTVGDVVSRGIADAVEDEEGIGHCRWPLDYW